ncbi:hypothetical protein HF324_11370 [Chitinophaga oryzae]|uniref:Uncharacterized protein n=1 Tax=Chitinophaga oryzae TaxID=2725414 RepID=A0ABX6LF67_9BACT|nr:hypothetical protein [Chitinophaga oryzae]QJB38433.1 hypothetical protein HF324_11370 [Chitinophaga oryzae]
MKCTFLRGLTPGLLFSIALLTACNGGQKKKDHQQGSATATRADSLSRQSPGETLSTQAYVDGIVSRRKAIEQQLPGISADAAVLLYRSLALYVDTALTSISNNEGGWLDKYVNYYSEEKNKVVPPDSVQRTIGLLATAGIEPWGIGEGYTVLRTVPDFYTRLFKNSLPPDYRSYLRLNADEDTVLYSADAGLSVPFSEVGQRALHWEQFIEAYPNSILVANARENYDRYCEDYLFGQDNTPSFDSRQDISSLVPENKAEYLSFVQKYGNTRTAGVVRLFLEKVNTEKSVDGLRQVVRNEIRQLFDDRVELLQAPADFGAAQIAQLTRPVYDTVPPEAGPDKVVRGLDSIVYFRLDGNVYCTAVFTNGVPDGGAPATGWMDVWVFKQAGSSWQAVAHQLNAGGGGMYGNSGYFSGLVKLGTHRIGIMVSGGITHMGSSISWDDVLAFSNDQLTAAFTITTSDAYDNANGIQRCHFNKWLMRPAGQEENYQLLIISGSCMDGSLPLEKTVVPFKNGGYNVPEKFLDRGI